MSGLINMATGEPTGGVGNCQYAIPVVPKDQPKALLNFQGTQERSGASHWAPEPPTPYEVRRDALMAAATYAGAGGWGGADNVIEKIAKPFEEYLNEAAGR